MKERGKRRGSLPYRVLLVVILGGALALTLAALSDLTLLPHQTTRALFWLAAGVLLIVAIALEIVFRDVAKLGERLRTLERERNFDAEK